MIKIIFFFNDTATTEIYTYGHTLSLHDVCRSPAYHFTEDWRSYANTPGQGMQFDQGKFKGRIYIAANHSSGTPQKAFKDYNAHGYYTDDHGKTFQLRDPKSNRLNSSH